jgi:hypothetical protein
MRHFMLILLAIVAVSVPLIAQPSPGADQQLITTEKSLPDAEKKKDAEFFKRALADDFIEVAIDGHVYDKHDLLLGLSSVNLSDYFVYNFRVLYLNDGAAVVTYDAVLHVTYDGERAPRYQHLSSVWVNQGGEWKLKFRQATPAIVGSTS